MQRVPVDELKRFGHELLTACGVPEAHAEAAVNVIVNTEAYGVHTHGLKMFVYLDAKLGDLLDPAAAPTIVQEKPATALLDGNRCMGQLAVLRALDIGMTKARECGVAMVGVRNTGWIGALGPYLIGAVEKGFLAQLWAQTNTCKDCAPVGGIDPKFSTNPVALAFPTGGAPMIGDLSSASVSVGRLGQMLRAGAKAPEPIFMDADGHLTDDPAVFDDGGSILFLGGDAYGHKGYCLSLWCEAMSALAGGDCNNPDRPQRQTINLTVIDPEAFAGPDTMCRELDRFVAHVKDTRLRKGVEAVRIPGERGYAELQASHQNGVPVEEHLLDSLRDIADRRDVDVNF